MIHLVHARESPVGGGGGETLEAARAVLRGHLDRAGAELRRHARARVLVIDPDGTAAPR